MANLIGSVMRLRNLGVEYQSRGDIKGRGDPYLKILFIVTMIQQHQIKLISSKRSCNLVALTKE